MSRKYITWLILQGCILAYILYRTLRYIFIERIVFQAMVLPLIVLSLISLFISIKEAYHQFKNARYYLLVYAVLRQLLLLLYLFDQPYLAICFGVSLLLIDLVIMRKCIYGLQVVEVYCEHCGLKVDPEDRQCPHCHAQFVQK